MYLLPGLAEDSRLDVSEQAVVAVLVVEHSPQSSLHLRVGKTLEELRVQALAPLISIEQNAGAPSMKLVQCLTRDDTPFQCSADHRAFDI